MKKQKKKILMVFTANMNLGDNVIGDCNEFLIRKACFPGGCEIFPYSISTRDVEQVRYVDAVVFAGGIMKSTSEKFWLYIPELIEAAQRYNVPVLLSGIGVEAFHGEDEKSVRLREALNLPCVKCMTVRDDIETLRRDYITNPEITLLPVYDVAVWSKAVYKKALRQMEPMRKRKVIGLGVVREKLFSDYGNPQIDRQVQLDFWKGVIIRLEEEGLPWEIFTNGDSYDELFAREVLAYVGHGSKAPVPMDAPALVQTISAYRGVIAGRMHSNIIAYALGIPSVGFLWNQKLTFWSEKIGYPERFLRPDEMHPEAAVERLLHGMKEGCHSFRKSRKPIYAGMKDFLKTYCVKRDVPKETISYKEHMIAPALGGMFLRYKNTNSMEAFWDSYSHGYRKFQVDVRLTADGELVCVNRWHPDTLWLLGHPVKEGEKPEALTSQEFAESKYYNRFPTMSFKAFLREAAPLLQKGEIQVVIGMGQPDREVMEQMKVLIPAALENAAVKPKQFCLRLERRCDMEAWEQMGSKIPMIYHPVPGKKKEEELVAYYKDAISYCKTHKIKRISVSPDNCQEAIVRLCKEAGMKIYVFTSFRGAGMVDALKLGADYVSNHYYHVEYMERLTKESLK